ncbi:hypothetical protein A3H85_00145 [Candidatus Daviesbacteria bacterium RIFCSPLOWO2_02_FULL_40_8]|uniref:ASCH domain-containing protein n=1 Tax=Candidatus Daviesbacteria bacterium RIFCSPLOWO2_01_FULL_40_24 TaxID=1797787 RepID=A0A1F5MJM6_9BACT|nr:MAG: hypothetical protein A2780_01335 [Candidatus Daviesbacteria bacterium RIFCSPHIGHO2_01_FULL_41_45]OGE35496.1 MAG: hypothetical protein A3C32_03545 [Candidatus Daviesbacteria bacterium RIFCSPHIGHO2_02_FULL_41_14]OGE65587.1 MAG: hypothetical protein A3B49_02120 [Candidatus Daviesbacteria bacterium RIFCSPLOWO2_01_FULL_40_24]OGE66519.1 MAG: hypothetical protein A3H85_00145 [Candidatus Daviesbacteria bacterium RIFCSPLOWO2_02_FULL_40_8]
MYISAVRKHLAIMPTLVIDAIISGNKTVETRFSKHKIVPFGFVSVGDLVYLKPPGEEVIGQFRVKKVFYFSGLEKQDIEHIFAEYGGRFLIGDDSFDKRYRKEKLESKFATLIFIKDPERFLTSPIRIQKSDKRGWVVID